MEQEARNPTRRRMVQALWQGRDPFVGFPATLYQVDPQGWNSGHRYLGEAIAELKPALVVEIGVWKGGSTMTLASGLKGLGPDGVVIPLIPGSARRAARQHDRSHPPRCRP